MSEETGASEAAAGRQVARNTTMDAVVAGCIAIVGGVVVFQAQSLGAQWTSDGPGPGYFPFYIGLILLVSGLVVLVQSLLARKADTGTFVDSVQLRRVLSVLVPSMLYVGAIMLLGIYVASAIFIAGFMIWLGKYAWLRSVAVGVVINAVFFAMFEIWFKVPLYKGALHPLAFLGY